MRIHFTPEDISEAILKAKIELRPEDCLVTKFSIIAEELGRKARKQARDEIKSFTSNLCWESKIED